MSDDPIICDVGDKWNLGDEFEDELYDKIMTNAVYPLVGKHIVEIINGSLPYLRLSLWWSDDRQDVGFLLRSDKLLGDGNVEFTVEHVIDDTNMKIWSGEEAKIARALRRMADRVEGRA